MAEAAKTPVLDVEKSLIFPVGFASPLWLAFTGAAATGAAFYWMSRWANPTNLEAKLAAPAPAPALPPVIEPVIAEPVAVETITETVAAVVEPAFEIAQIAAETVMTSVIEQSAALVEALDPAEPVVEPLAETAIEAFEAAEPLVETPAEAIVETVEAVAPVAKAAIDDLTVLVGIGPKLAVSLAERGVTSYGQLAAWTAKDLEEVDQALSLKGRAVRDAWVAQARRLADAAS